MSKTSRENTALLIKELFKHARRDDCYECKRLLKAMGLDPRKSFEETFQVQE